MDVKRTLRLPLFWLLCASVTAGACRAASPSAPTPPPAVSVVSAWSASQNGTILQVSYGRAGLQYAALHTESGYIRMNAGAGSAWGTSAVIVPCIWTGGRYLQGAPISTTWRVDGTDFLISFAANVSTLSVHGEVRLLPPTPTGISAIVTVTVDGDVALDVRPGEAFKVVMLSSMHVAANVWDARAAFVDASVFAIPDEGWLIQPAVRSTFFGVMGGTSNWKTNAPTIDVLLDQPLQITGWLTRSANANDDNVGMWAASDSIVRRWQYRLRAVMP